jgi:hypothetical protein
MKGWSSIGFSKASGDLVIQANEVGDADEAARSSEIRKKRPHRLPGIGRLFLCAHFHVASSADHDRSLRIGNDHILRHGLVYRPVGKIRP